LYENWKSEREYSGQLLDEVAKLHELRFDMEKELARYKAAFKQLGVRFKE
jgi:hypothetical protein